jgi:hypothetical protein
MHRTMLGFSVISHFKNNDLASFSTCSFMGTVKSILLAIVLSSNTFCKHHDNVLGAKR